MLLLQVVVILVVIGVILGLINRYGGEYIPANIIRIINGVVVIAIILWLLWWLLAAVGLTGTKVPMP